MKKILFDKVDALQKQINAHGKLDSNILNKINYKLRLDWNYYSNKMEGGTLTREETRSVMVENIDIHGKPLKDVIEMKGHDEMVLDILKIAKGEIRISEKRIKEIHQAIMYEESIAKRKLIGNWKKQNNHVINYKNEKFYFVEKNLVAEKLHELLNKTNADLDAFFNGKPRQHPLEIAIHFHEEFLEIHPFYDGNGRVGRILTNLILMSCGFPIFIIKENTKKRYYQLLADIQCYGGNIDLLENFIAERIIDSQELILSAIKGENISEEDDLDKQLALLDKEFEAEDSSKEIKTGYSDEVLKLNYENWIKPLFQELVKTTIKFNKYYTDVKHYFNYKLKKGQYEQFYDEPNFEGLEVVFQDENYRYDNELTFTTGFGAYKKGGLDTFNCRYQISIKFENYNYVLTYDEFNTISKKRENAEPIKRLLHNYLSEKEIKDLSTKWGKSLLNHLEEERKKINQ